MLISIDLYWHKHHISVKFGVSVCVISFFPSNFCPICSAPPLKNPPISDSVWHHQSIIIIIWQRILRQCQLTNMLIQLSLAMSGIQNMYKKKKGCDELLYENMQCYCNQMCSQLVDKHIPMFLFTVSWFNDDLTMSSTESKFGGYLGVKLSR